MRSWSMAVDQIKHYAEGISSRSEMVAWITEVVDHGVRRPGTEAGHRVEAWVAHRLRYLGLEDVHTEAVAVPVWEPGPARLTVWPAGDPATAVTLAGFPVAHAASTDGLEGAVVAYDPARPRTHAGAIVVEEVQSVRLPHDTVRRVASGTHDPDGALGAGDQVVPPGPGLGAEIDAAVEGSAAAYVGVLGGPAGTRGERYQPYDGVARPIPALWLGADGGARLARLMARGPVRGRVEVAGRTFPGRTANVVGTLRGASDQWVVIGSHHDAPWASAVEDGSGIALVLAQARFWARVRRSHRPHNLLFLLTGGHTAGGAGLASFIGHHRRLLDDVVAAIGLEHVAAAWRSADGRLVPAAEPEVRWWFTSPDPGLRAAVAGALRAEDVRRSWIMPPDALGPAPPTAGGRLHHHGVPLVELTSAPAYLADPDTLAMVHEASLEPLTRAAVRIVASLGGRTAAEVRAGCAEVPPSARGA